MKKKRISKNKRFYTTLIKNYALFTITTMLILFIVAVVGVIKVIGLVSMLSHNDYIESQKPLLEKGQYSKIDVKKIENENGWIEIIDKNNNIIYSKGKVQEDKKQYTKSELDAMINPDSIPYYIEKYEFKNKQGEELLLISKIPKSNNKEKIHSKGAQYIKDSFFQLLILFIILYVINICIFIFLLNKKVKKPLCKITNAMNDFAEKNEEIYIDYNGEEEFVQICNSFNHMVRKLKEVEKENKLLEDSRQTMLANISHDLKTPITTVQGYAKAISEGYVTDKEEMNKYLNIIYKKSNKVTDLINLLFEYVKLGHPDFKLNLAYGDLSEFVREIVAENYEHIEDCGFILNFSIPEEELLCNFDKNQLRRALSNLIGNSLKYNKEGTKIEVSLKIAKEHYIINIADNGVGIPEHVRKELFVPFVTGDESRNVNAGTGLGLSIAKQIIEKHGGTIELISLDESDFSTEFKIKLRKG